MFVQGWPRNALRHGLGASTCRPSHRLRIEALGGVDAVRGRRGFGDRQQLDRKCDSAQCPWKKEPVVCWTAGGGRTRRGDLYPAGQLSAAWDQSIRLFEGFVLAPASGQDHGDQAVHALAVGQVMSGSIGASRVTCLIQNSRTSDRAPTGCLSTGYRLRACENRAAVGDGSPSRKRGFRCSVAVSSLRL